MNPDILITNNINALKELIKEYISQEDYEQFELYIKNLEMLKKWLMDIPLTDRDAAILYIAKNYLPIDTLHHIQWSLSYHNEFWNEFYLNMLKAKALLTQ